MEKKNETIKDPTGFTTIKVKPTIEELKKHYDGLFQNYKHKKIRKNYQDSYDEIEIKHINLMNDLCLYSLTNANPEWIDKPGSLLEVGVGEGFFLAKAKEKGWNVTGIDFNDNGVKKFNPELTEKMKLGNAFDLLKECCTNNNKFDVCIIQNVLEHVIDPRELLNDLRNLLTKDGIVVVRVPNDYSRTQTRAMELGHINNEFWVAPPEHLNYFNTKNLIDFIKSINFHIIDMFSGFPIDFFLFHPGSNYILNEENGKTANRARVELDLLMSESGIDNYYNLCKSWARCDIGRLITVLIKSKN